MRRLFVPLCSAPYEDFKLHGKRWEVRALARQYTPRNLVEGREAELRKGYSGESLHGVIGRVECGTLEEIFSRIPLREIEPRASSVKGAIEEDRDLLGEHILYVAFEVLLDRN